ncbi:recombinase family protein [Streptomyces sp. NPDC048200]|uniref:recombinase family protein n=1 Tax=Streptomyces sp. NPDC048200 TaxID=3365512 RepID=UPI0037106DE3
MTENVETAIRVVRRVVRCFIYARISEDREGAHLATERQTDDCRALAEQLSTPQVEYRIVRIFEDNDLSAYSGKPRPDYLAMLAALRNDEADCVLAWHTDRLHRSPVELEEYIDVCGPADIDTRTVKAGQLDLSTATGRWQARQLGAMARFEVERMIERSKRARDQKVGHGEYSGGPRPFGYEADGVTPRTLLCPDCGRTGPDGFTARRQCDGCGAVDRFTRNLTCQACDAKDTLQVTQICTDCRAPAEFEKGSEASAIRAAAEAILSGAALNSLAREMKAAGLSTSHGKDQRAPNLRAVLLRPRNAGLMKHRGEIIGRADWMPLVDEATWRSMVAVLEDPARLPSATNARKHLGSNIYRCGVCEATLKASSKPNRRGGGTRPVYRCRVKDCVTRDLPDLDEYVIMRLMHRLQEDDADQMLSPREEPVDVRALQQEMRTARRRLDDLAASFGAGEMDRQEWRAAAGPARARFEKAEKQMESAVKRNPAADLIQADDPVAFWNSPEFDLSRQRASLDYLMVVTVHPARKGRMPGGGYFDASTVQVDWK